MRNGHPDGGSIGLGTSPVSSAARRGGSMTGTLTNGTLDATETMGNCSYHYVLNKA